MKIVAVIPAKGNSNRLPNKNIIDVNGKPMICWAIEACKESKHDIEVWVNSDSEEILTIAKKSGARIKRRDDFNLGDDVPKHKIIQETVEFSYACNGYIPDIVISLQANSPEVRGKDLDAGIEALLLYNKDEIFSVNDDMMQNAAFRVMKGGYALIKKEVSTHCGVVVCNLIDVHTEEDLEKLK